MTEKLYYWAENLEGYSSDNEQNYDQVMEIKRLNFFIGKNNAGKSRFLRKLFTTTIPFEILNYPTNMDQISKIKFFLDTLDDYDSRFQLSNHSGYNKNHILPYINNILSAPLFPRSEYKNIFDKNYEALSKFTYNHDSYTPELHEQIKKKIEYFDKEIGFTLTKYYVPILRGMRPVTEIEFQHPYIARTQKDYFSNINKFNSKNIITGESLYHELKIHLLGEPEQREVIKNYEEKLSQYFFDNETITLIPKHEQDVVNIKIGNDKQFPISELGDGLQQVIILTYEAFIKKDQTHAFFIEEPELHMHAGMVRQLMNFYLNETNHYYFFTTHSNHLLDMADESDQVIIQKFVKEPNKDDSNKFDFKIYRCDRDRDLLASLGVKPSSVYLANCTIWVEGITDRLYITKYMEKYLAELENSDAKLYKKYCRFMPNYHYTFVEYAGSNLTHWSFSDDYADHLDDKGLSAKAVASEMLLIADGDIKEKADRVKKLTTELKSSNFFKFECKEIENTLPKNSIIRVAKQRFNRMKNNTKQGFSIENLDTISRDNHFEHNDFGIGKLLDNQIRNPRTNSEKLAFADSEGVGTIKNKLDFCREIIKDFDENPDWQLTPKAKEVCECIFQHIEKCN
ncbi:AAA family ATPase [Acinetobacter sp. WCHAc010052]|uniref:AAA family ATPase n=1 Tax=Acinetobacter sp. WCHAc010052 TaxID=2004647 RepID=UPI000B3D145B|nr:AAA family ATPase [Acinetobacter sp. WCHAc010052]AXY61016.1 ATP-binding protein [Acinetobacter sp. WCHAc010052]